MEHTFHFNNCMAETGVYLALRKALGPLTFPPVILCIGSDLAVGADSDIGLIKVVSQPLQPGAGANKKLPKIGDVSVLGIVAKKSPLTYALFNLTRMGVVYSMAEIIANSIQNLTNECCENLSKTVS